MIGNGGSPYLFTARRYDSETGLYYYRARYYNPQIGRFMQPDPIGHENGMNVYTYVGNNPSMRRDPHGLAWTEERCEDNYRRRLSRIAAYVGDCIANYCGGISPVNASISLCLASCAKSGPHFPTCFTACSIGSSVITGSCHVQCARHGHQQERSAAKARAFCLCVADCGNVADCTHHLD